MSRVNNAISPNYISREYDLAADYNLSPTAAAISIQKNITTCIELVNQNRLDIIRLDNELKISKNDLNQKWSDDSKMQSDITHLIAKHETEKNVSINELSQIKTVLENKEDQLQRNELIAKETIQTNKDLLRIYSKKQTELDFIINSLSTSQNNFEQKRKTLNELNLRAENLSVLEQKMNLITGNYKVENQRNLKLNSDILILEENCKLKINENEKLRQQIRKNEEVSGIASDEVRGKLADELHVDLKMMITLKDELELLMHEIEEENEDDE